MAELASYSARPAASTSQAIPEQLFRRLDGLKSQRQLWESDWQDVVNLLVPGADDILHWRAPGQSRTEQIFDARPLQAPQILAANIQGGITNPAMQWSRLRFRAEELNTLQHVNAWLEACDDSMRSLYNGSSFYQAAYTYYLHLGAFGTAAMYVAQSQRAGASAGLKLQCRTLSPGSYWIAENAEGRVDTLFRDCWFTPRQAVELFGDGVSQRTAEKVARHQGLDVPERYLHAAYPRLQRNPRKADNRQMPWAACYADYETRSLVQETGYEEFPFVVSRWETLGQSPYGVGPGHLALPDVRVLNKLRELNLEQLVLWARPPLTMLREGVIGSVSLQPYALNVLSQADALKPLDLTGRPDLVQITAQELVQSIQDLFYVHALQALPPPEAAQMTAFEVAHRLELMQRVMGPALTRLLSEMLDPLSDRVFGLALRGGLFPQPPMEVLEAALRQQGQLDVEYEGPLARAQRGSEVQSLGQIIGMYGQIASTTQSMEVLDNIDWDRAARDIATVTGGQRVWVRDVQDVLRMRQARAQAQQQAQQQQQFEGTAAALGRVAPAIQAYQALQPQQQAA